MNEKRELLRHFLAALAYRTTKALRGAPSGFASFDAGHGIRSPHAILSHMHSVLGYARTRFVGGGYHEPPLESFEEEVARFHAILESLAGHLSGGTPLRDTTPEQLLQGPFADAMTHAGQLAMLRRMCGSPIPPENFLKAYVDSSNVGPDQATAAKPGNRYAEWPDGPGGPRGDRGKPGDGSR